MKPSRTPRLFAPWLLRVSASCLLAFPLALLPSCARDFGTGGTGERVIPLESLRRIDPVAMRDLGPEVRPPDTAPTTLAATERAAVPGPVASATAAAAAPEVVRLTVEECRRMALANNLDLQVELLGPSIARTAVSEQEARFEALFVGSVAYGVVDAPTASRLEAQQGNSLRIEPGISIPLRTGGTIDVDVPIARDEQEGFEFSSLNPAYESDLRLRLTQPLLRNAGARANSHAIRVAFYQYQASEARARLEVIRVLALVERAYWRLYAARRELEVRREEYELAREQLRRARRRAEVGQDPRGGVEVIRAESGVADRVQAIILAENALRDRQRELKRVMNDPSLPMAGATVIIPEATPSEAFFRLDPANLVRVAMAQRMELLEAELQALADASAVNFARNQALPLVALEYTYNANGLGDAFDSSLRMLRDKDFEDHAVGLRVEVPIGNEAARARLRRALAERMRTLATRRQREQAIEQEVLNAIDQLESDWQRIVAARERVRLARRVVDAEVRQFENQLRTSTDVNDALTRLAAAESELVAAQAQYQISQVDLAFATGTVLGAARVVWEPIRPPER